MGSYSHPRPSIASSRRCQSRETCHHAFLALPQLARFWVSSSARERRTEPHHSSLPFHHISIYPRLQEGQNRRSYKFGGTSYIFISFRGNGVHRTGRTECYNDASATRSLIHFLSVPTPPHSDVRRLGIFALLSHHVHYQLLIHWLSLDPSLLRAMLFKELLIPSSIPSIPVWLPQCL